MSSSVGMMTFTIYVWLANAKLSLLGSFGFLARTRSLRTTLWLANVILLLGDFSHLCGICTGFLVQVVLSVAGLLYRLVLCNWFLTALCIGWCTFRSLYIGWLMASWLPHPLWWGAGWRPLTTTTTTATTTTTRCIDMLWFNHGIAADSHNIWCY